MRRELGRKPATYADLEALPENMVGEILDGELFAMPRPAVPHSNAASGVNAAVRTRFGGGGPTAGWWILVEPELHLHGDIVVPDVAGWRRSNMPVLPATAAIERAPDWVLEVVAPRTATIDRIKKARIYARERVGHYWLLDPVERTLEVLRLHEGHWLRVSEFQPPELVGAEPFEAVEFDSSDWFMPEEPKAP